MLVAEGDGAARGMRNLNKVKLAIYSILLSNACLPQQQTALPSRLQLATQQELRYCCVFICTKTLAASLTQLLGSTG